MDFITYIVDQALILIPVLYLLGKFFKVSSVPDKFIPMSLLLCGIVLSMCMLGINVHAFIQGVLVAGAAVFTNELITQTTKDE